MNIDQHQQAGDGLLDQIVAASLLEQQHRQVPSYMNQNHQHPRDPRTLRSSDLDEESGEEEAFEDGDENELDNSDDGAVKREKSLEQSSNDSVAAVLTELTNNITNNPSTNAVTTRHNNPQMAATINSINALLQSHLNANANSASSIPQKVRLSGPIRANVNIRHGVWAPRLRCRKRKNLHAKDGIWIHPTCTLDHLIALVRSVLPDEFEWDCQASPLRYQAVNDQSLQSLKTVNGTVAGGQGLYAAFDLVRNRRSDGDNFILQLYVYGTWTILLKNNQVAYHHEEDLSSNSTAATASAVQPPPKKKYQQAHYSQQQSQVQQVNNVNSVDESQGMFSHMRLPPVSGVSSSNNTTVSTGSPVATTNTTAYYTHPLAANPPVTFLPTVTLEMKLNGTFVPVEVSRRSFVAAIRACSIPKTPVMATAKDEQAVTQSSPPVSAYNVTPPPSEA